MAKTKKTDSPDSITVAVTPSQVRELRDAMQKARGQGKSEVTMHLHLNADDIEIVEGWIAADAAIALDKVT